MDLMSARVALRERPLLDVFDLAVRFVTTHAAAYARLSLVVLLPSFGVSWAASHFGGWWVGWAVTVVVGAFASAPYVSLASRLVFDDSVTVRQAVGAALRALPSLVAVRLVEGIGLWVTCVIGWLWLGSVYVFMVEVLVLEQARVRGAFGRASRLANAHFGGASSTMLILLVAPIGAAMIADVAGRELMQSVLEIRPPPSMFHEGGSTLALVGWWLAMPWLATARFFVYLDTRTRTEGWDIQTRFAAIAARAGAADAERRAA
jgi:hypothetical protein